MNEISGYRWRHPEQGPCQPPMPGEPCKGRSPEAVAYKAKLEELKDLMVAVDRAKTPHDREKAMARVSAYREQHPEITQDEYNALRSAVWPKVTKRIVRAPQAS